MRHTAVARLLLRISAATHQLIVKANGIESKFVGLPKPMPVPTTCLVGIDPTQVITGAAAVIDASIRPLAELPQPQIETLNVGATGLRIFVGGCIRLMCSILFSSLLEASVRCQTPHMR